jgi:secondary thiamine-phosphate synthase enzyme
MKQLQQEFTLNARGQRLYDITREMAEVARQSGVLTGLATVFCRHTSASLLINENADPDVLHDLEAFMKRLVPDGDRHFIHRLEGPDDMAAHIKTALTTTSFGIPITDGKLALGAWQGVYLFEHRVAPHGRRMIVHILGE